jgi:hypothetical protein
MSESRQNFDLGRASHNPGENTMADEPHVTDHQNAVNPAPMQTEAKTGFFGTKTDETPKVKTETKEDHLGIIAELANTLHNVSPSGAMTVRDKILERIAAIQDPKAYDERMAAAKKAEDEAEKIRAKDRAANKQPVPEKAKV